jgi:hypothetical protein
LVLLAPFLPQLFTRLDLIRSDGKLSKKGQARAVHLLQWLVDGRPDQPEPMLALNKVVCGLPLAAVVPPSIDPSEEELALCGSLLDAMIAQWPAIAGSTVETLRETFLQREGRLNATDGGWSLTVGRKTLDVLVDTVPWSFSPILCRWMGAALTVAW